VNANVIEPKLDAPGAGLPAAELLIARWRFGRALKHGNRESFIRQFQLEREKIRELVRCHDADSAARRVLIERVRGMADSSRFWSIWMTLDHLRIVHLGITRTVSLLLAGKRPPGKADTAAVKPSADVTGIVVDEFEKSCDGLLKVATDAADLRTQLRHEHPWFGPLDAFGWLALAAGHLGVHREQIERIGAQLPR